MLSRNRLRRIESDWEQRGLFHKRRRFAGKVWLVLVALLALAIFHTRMDIPDLLLDGFKLIAHLVPVRDGAVR
jgi:hypothetical protein